MRVHSAHFVLLLHRRDPEDGVGGRLGLVAARRVGNAVARNRGKRLVREWFRRLPEGRMPDVDIVVILKPGIADHGADLWSSLDAALDKALRSRRTKKHPGRGNGPHRE